MHILQRKARMVGAVVAVVMAAGLQAARAEMEKPELLQSQAVNWKNAPRVDLVTRTCADRIKTMWETFMPTYLVSVVFSYRRGRDSQWFPPHRQQYRLYSLIKCKFHPTRQIFSVH